MTENEMAKMKRNLERQQRAYYNYNVNETLKNKLLIPLTPVVACTLNDAVLLDISNLAKYISVDKTSLTIVVNLVEF